MKNSSIKKNSVIKSAENDTKYSNVGYSSLNLNSVADERNDRKLSVDSVHQFQNKNKTTYFETLSHMFNGNIGCGILGMGMAFKNGGLFFSTGIMILVSVVALYNQHVLIYLASKFEKQLNLTKLTLSEAVSVAFDTGPPRYKKFTTIVKNSMSFFVFIGQMGTCCAYLVYIAETLQQILHCYDIQIKFQLLLAITMLLIWLTCLIREIKHITPVSNLANIATFISLMMILYTNFLNLPRISSRDIIGDWKKIPLSFGTMIFSMEGLSLTLPVQQNMKKRNQFDSIFGVLNVTIIAVAILTSLTGFTGYWKHGDAVKDSLTLNVELKNNILSQIIVVSMMIGIFCTYSLQFLVPVHILLPRINHRTSKWALGHTHFYEYLLRSILVFITYMFAAFIPYFNLIISLIGAVAGSFIGYIFCPLSDLIVREKDECGTFLWRRFMAVLSIILGLLAFVVGSLTALIEIVNAIKKDFFTQNDV